MKVMDEKINFVHDLALDGDEGWKVGDVVNLSQHSLDTEDREWGVVERDEVGGYWYFEEV